MIEVLGHRVLLEMLIEEEKKSEGGIIIDHKISDEQSEKGKVAQIGNRAYKEVGSGESWIDVGDVVIIQRHAGKPITYENKIYRVINDEDVLLRVKQ